MTARPAPAPKTPTGFLSVACRLSLLDEATAIKLDEDARAAETSPAQLALRQGLLDAVQVDIVETLLHPHDVVPGYEILDLIGQGGMGIVFRARQKSLDRVVALKTILFSQTQDQTALARFEQEALAVARLRHPNIVAAFDLGRAQGRLYFVMELIEGTDVERLVDSTGRLDESTTWGLVRQAASGLSHAAAAGIVHRDVKPANLLLVDPPAGFELPGGLKMVKITDFGLAFLTRDAEIKTRLTQANTAIGSPHYLAPEQLEGDSFDHRVDIYALGATAYHMLAGQPPFHAKTLPQIIARKLSTDSLDLRAEFPHVSPASADLVRRMTERDPARRVADYSQLIAQIDALKSAAPIPKLAPRPSSVLATTQLISSDPTPGHLAFPATAGQPARPRSFGRRKFLLALGGGSVAAAAIAAGAWSLRSSRDGKQSRPLVPTGLGLNLFDGMSLNGWRTHSGSWRVTRNSEGGRVLAGSSGTSRHTLINQVGKTKTTMTYFRLSTVIQLNKAKAAAIEFGIDRSLGEDGERCVAQLTDKGASAGRRADNFAPYVPLTDVKPLPHGPADPYTLIVERQPDSWWVLLDEIPVGSLPLSGKQEDPAFLLRADGGEAWFSDITAQELAPPQKDSPSP